MNTNDFLTQVLGDDGYYCVFGVSPDKKRKPTKFYHTLDKIAPAGSDMSNNGLNAYFALATFREAGRRTAENAKLLKSLFVDIDCGPEKDYLTQRDGLVALRQFCQKTGFPKPIIVDSGRGLHVYWPFDKPLPASKWKPLASALKECCRKEGLRTDRAVTDDAARVLRIPGTKNYKDNPATEVKLLVAAGGETEVELFEQLLADYMGDDNELGFEVNREAFGDVSETAKRLMANSENVFETILDKSLDGRGCEQIAIIYEEQETIEEPLWRAGLSIAAVCEDAEWAAEEISKDYPGYSRRETLRKMSQTAGPYTCETFEDLNPEGCKGCPLKGKITSPVQLGRGFGEAESEEEDGSFEISGLVEGDPTERKFIIPKYPKPFYRGKQGGVFVRTTDDEGETVEDCVYINDLYFVRRIYDKDEGESLLARLHLPNDSVREFTVSLAQATSAEDLRKVLAARGVVGFGKKHWERIMSYANTWVTSLQNNTEAHSSHRQFGWVDDDNPDTFVVGDKVIYGDRVDHNPPNPATAALIPAYSVKGTKEGWMEQLNFFNRDGMEPFQFMVCLTLGAPLVVFTPHHAAMFALFSDGSGHGKTTAQEIGLAAYGRPDKTIMQNKDTVNFRMNRMEVLKNLPAQWDEMTNMAPDVASELIYSLQSGTQKGRMSSGSNMERITGDPWKTSCGFTSNHSLLAKIRNTRAMNDGETMRILEYHARPYNFATVQETRELSKKVGKHYGHFTVPFIQFIINNREMVKEMMDRVSKKIDKEANLTAKNRFWSSTVTIPIVSCMIAKKLGFLDYDPVKLMDWSLELLKLNKNDAMEQTVSAQTHVANYVADNFNSILWIKSTDDLRGKVSHGEHLDSLVAPEQQPRMKLVARYETDTKLLFLLIKPLQKWCADNHINYKSLVEEMKANMGAASKKIKIAKGTKMNLPSVHTIMVDCRDVEIDHDGRSDD